MRRIGWLLLAFALALPLPACTPNPGVANGQIDNSSAPVDLQRGLLVHYPLDAAALDLGEAALHGETFHTSPTTGHSGDPDGALRFNGTDSLITIPDHPTLDLVGDFSISFFIQGSATSNHEWLILTKHQAGICQPSDTSWMLRYSAAHGLRLVNYDHTVDCGKTILAAPELNLADERWHHIVIVHNQDQSRIALYLDAQPIVENDASQLQIGDNSQPLLVGNQFLGIPDHALEAAIDELRIYDRVLNAAEIQQLFSVAP